MRTGSVSCRRILAAAVLAAGAACSSSVPIPDGAQLTCPSASECPAGSVCHNGMCQRIGAFDTTAPNLVSLVVSPGAPWDPTTGFGKAGTTFTIDLVASEALSEPPSVTIGALPPVEVTCTPTGGSAHRCTYQATGDENGGYGGVVKLDVRLRDRSRNENRLNGVGALQLDFSPPAVAAASVVYYPGPSNPLPAVQSATAGTLVHVAVTASELLDPSVATSLSVDFGGGPVAFDPVIGSATPIGAAFEAVLPAGIPDGSYTPSVTFKDLAGNVVTTSAGLPAIAVKTSLPVLSVDQDAVVFVRSPWGNSAPERPGGASGYTIPAGPYFALEPSDVLTASASLPAGALLLAKGTTPTAVLVKNSGEAGALILGTLRPAANGAFPRRALSSPDLPTVHVTGIDDAGNESAPVKIQNVEWVGTPNPPLTGANPNLLEWVGYVSSTRDQALEVHAADPTSLGSAAGGDGEVILARAAATWREDAASTSLPSARHRPALAYDSARGRVVLFGGSSSASGLASDTWEWNGNAWTLVATTGPSARVLHAMVYDSARGRVVLFGGSDGGLSNYKGDTWEWDGSTWTQVATSGPRARERHAMAYDSGRGRVVVYGGVGIVAGVRTAQLDTWEWDGSVWRQVATTAGPGYHADHAMAYDSGRRRVVLFGGGNGQDTWEWNGSAWTMVAVTGPVARWAPAMAFDAARGRVVLFGGTTASGGVALDDTWEWNGSGWTEVAATGPSARNGAMAYDGARGRVVLFGGNSGGVSDTWMFDGSAWVRSATAGPSGRWGHAMAYDSGRARVVLFGGNSGGVGRGDTWEWDGTDWTSVSTTGPSARHLGAMAYDSARGRAVLFGGLGAGSALGDTWEWDGTVWTSVSTTGPSARFGHAMAYDSARGQVVLFGSGQTGQDYGHETWAWNGSTWTQVATVGPPGRMGCAMAYDSARERVVLFGGNDWVQRQRGDTWEWDGSLWTSVTFTGPRARYGHAMAYDSDRGRVVLIGGWSSPSETSTWDWTGSAWKKITTAGPGGRFYHAMAYDRARGRTVLFGGSGDWGDTWELQAAPGHQPAAQLDASIREAGISASSMTRIRVRAFAGGTFHPGGAGAVGATLLGWSNGYGVNGEPGEWVPLAVNNTGVATQPPYLSAVPTSLVDWQTSSASETQRFLTARDGQLSFQVRPSGPAGPDVDGSQVALDYIEARVRHTAP